MLITPFVTGGRGLSKSLVQLKAYEFGCRCSTKYPFKCSPLFQEPYFVLGLVRNHDKAEIIFDKLVSTSLPFSIQSLPEGTGNNHVTLDLTPDPNNEFSVALWEDMDVSFENNGKVIINESMPDGGLKIAENLAYYIEQHSMLNSDTKLELQGKAPVWVFSVVVAQLGSTLKQVQVNLPGIVGPKC